LTYAFNLGCETRAKFIETRIENIKLPNMSADTDPPSDEEESDQEAEKTPVSEIL